MNKQRKLLCVLIVFFVIVSTPFVVEACYPEKDYYVLKLSLSTISDDFESGNFVSGGWTTSYGHGGLAPSVQNTIKHQGTYAAQFSLGAAGAYSVGVKDLGATYSVLYCEAYVRFSKIPALNQYLLITPDIMDVYEYDISCAYIHNNAGTLKWCLEYRDNAGAHYVDDPTGASVQVNTWYCVEVMCTTGTGTGAVSMWVNEVPLVKVTGLTNTNYPLSKLQIGAYSPAVALATDVYVDDVVSDTSYIGTGSLSVTITLKACLTFVTETWLDIWVTKSSPVNNAIICFYSCDKGGCIIEELGTAKTDKNGIATFSWSINQVGDYWFVAQYSSIDGKNYDGHS